MKIIDIGICIDNLDPKGIGRIRYRPYGMFVSEIENGAKYTKWDELDPFIALPFLPPHINIIPQIQQSVKIIQYDTNKELQNVEYVSGPYTSPHDAQNQTFATQHKDTTYGGVIIKGIKSIRNPDGSYNKPTTRGAILDNRDTGFRGNYGSDIIFTENGVQIRGGMLISKKGTNKKDLLDYPQLAKKMGRLALKKFPTTYRSYTETVEKNETASDKLKYIIEYEINNLTSPTELRLFVYKVISPHGTQFNTNLFGDNTLINYTENSSQVYLINTTFTATDPTYRKTLDGTITSACSELRNLLYQIDNTNLTVLDYTYPREDIYPFYFRPTPTFKLLRGNNDTETANKTAFLSKIQLRNRTNGTGLIFSRQNVNPPVITSKQEIIKSQEIKGSGEQSFSFLSSDKIYLASTDPNIGKNVKSIDFNDLDEYELTQDDYVSTIEPNTYSLVRGENLYNFLVALKNVIDRHIHNINEPPVKTGESGFEELNKLMDSLKDDLLNNSIRIN